MHQEAYMKFLSLTREELSERICSYDGEIVVTREQVEDVIDFNILLEPEDNDDENTASAQYAASLEQWRPTLEKGNEIVRNFGKQTSSFEELQETFYSFTNSLKYRKSLFTISISRVILSKNWEGIHGWRD
jgi:hypothetical protein